MTGHAAEPKLVPMPFEADEDLPFADRSDLVTLSTVAPTRISWLWPGYVPFGKVTILDGDPGLGKSTILLDLAARGSIGGRTATGDQLLHFDTIIVTGEDDPADTIRPRLELAGGDARRIHLRTALTLPEDADQLERDIEQIGARLVYIDPIVAYLAEEVRTASDHQVRRALAPLVEIAKRQDCAVVAIRHLNKQSGGDAVYRGGGSIGFAGLARSVLAVGRDPEDEDRFVLASVKINVARRPTSLSYRLEAAGPYEPARVVWEGESAHTAESLIGKDRDQAQDRTKVEQFADAIRELVQRNGGSMRASDGWKALESEGWDTRSNDLKLRARRKSGVETVKGGMDEGWLWRLPA
jgi:AAA domain